LLEDGANVIINGRNTTDVEQAVAALNKRFGAGVRLARTDMKGMLRRGNGRRIFISSEEALTPMASMAHYSLSKAMRLSISRSPTESR
jgi:3-oxoacyl-[acyl-carrier protein] reductase